MTDIVERLLKLRGDYAGAVVIQEAADEIERLRAALQAISDLATVHTGDYEIMVDDEELETFIGRALEPKP